jgi:hypothetical protein
VEEAHPERQHGIESHGARIENLHFADMKLGPPGGNMCRITPSRCRDHLPGSIDRHNPAIPELLADQSDGNPMAATDLQDEIARADLQPLNRGFNTLAHGYGAGWADLCSALSGGGFLARGIA